MDYGELFHLTERTVEPDRHCAIAADRRYAPARGLRLSAGVLPGAVWRDIAEIEQWSAALDRGRPVVFCCRFAPSDEPDCGGASARRRRRSPRARGRLCGLGRRPDCRS